MNYWMLPLIRIEKLLGLLPFYVNLYENEFLPQYSNFVCIYAGYAARDFF